MGFWGLTKANLDSIRVQREIEEAIEAGDGETVSDLISQSTVRILKAGLTSRQRQNLDQLKQDHTQEMETLLTDAFQRGWMRDGVPNLSNGMDEVLLAVQERIKKARTEGEC